MEVIFTDFFQGFALAQLTALVWGVWSLAVGVVAGVCWVGGGQGWLGTKAWRRLGVPVAVCLPFLLSGHVVGAFMSAPLQIMAQSIGYGTPSTQPPDAGSWLGQKFGNYARVAWWLIMGIAVWPLFL